MKLKIILPRQIYSSSIAQDIDPSKVRLLKRLLDIIPRLTMFKMLVDKGVTRYDIAYMSSNGEEELDITLSQSSTWSNGTYHDIDVSFNQVDEVVKVWNREDKLERIGI